MDFGDSLPGTSVLSGFEKISMHQQHLNDYIFELSAQLFNASTLYLRAPPPPAINEPGSFFSS